ncbi:ribosomal subunit interface protein [gamma proteobacterium HTCC5015]|nr:ribosomal subunit interface protein [gamma proteobacterium HTCC5015]
MHINLTGHHLDLTDALRDYVNDKFTRLERHFDHVTQIHVILGPEKHQHKAEAKMHVPHVKGELFAHAEHEDMYAAIDGLVDKLDRQLLKHKEKLTDHHKREKAAIAEAAEAAAASAL